MVARNVMAAAGAALFLGATAVPLAQTAGQPGSSNRRYPPVAPQVEQRFEIQAPWGGSTTARRLGVTLKELTPAETTARKLPSHSAVLVETVQPKGPAEKAGMKSGDVILKVNLEPVRSIAQVRRLVNETAIAQQALVTIFRDGKTMDLFVTPEEASLTQDLLPDNLERRLEEFGRQLPRSLDQLRRSQPQLFGEPFTVPRMPSPQFRWPLNESSPGASRLGAVIQELGPQLADYFKVKAGVLVASVTSGSPAAQAGLKAGDVITALNGTDVKVPGDVARAIRDLPDGREVSLSIVRNGAAMTLKVKLGAGRGVWHV
jgi:serine protease Do